MNIDDKAHLGNQARRRRLRSVELPYQNHTQAVRKRNENEPGRPRNLESASVACPYRARDWSRSVASPPKSC